MDSAIFYVLEFLWNAICHPLQSGWATWLGILMLAVAGFLMQLLAILRTRQTAMRLLPLAVSAVFCLYGELRWSGIGSLAGDGAGQLPTNRFSGFIFCFVGLPMLLGAAAAWLWVEMRRRKSEKEQGE